MQEIIVKTRNLSKWYQEAAALDKINLTVYRQDIYGVIGAGGSGKTTLLQILTGLTARSGGDFELFGKNGLDAAAERRRIGCLVGSPAFFDGMSAAQNLKYYALQKGITDMRRLDEALTLAGLTGSAGKKQKKTPQYRQRLGIALALLGKPELVLLDEPFRDLAEEETSRLLNTIQTLNENCGITFILSAKTISELAPVANRFLVLDHGKKAEEFAAADAPLSGHA